MAKTFQLKIVTPERQVVSLDVESVILPGLEGSFGVLANHAPMLSALKPGLIKVAHGNVCDVYACSGGYAEVTGDSVIVLADALENGGEIDPERAKKALQRAEDRLTKHEAGIDIDRAALARDRARTRIQLFEETPADVRAKLASKV